MSFEENPQLSVRNALPEEVDEVAALIEEAYRQYRSDFPGDAWDEYLKDITDVRSRQNIGQLIVAIYEGRLAGSVTLFLDPSLNPESRWPEDWAAIRLLAVYPEFRKMGIGKALLRECIRRSRRHGKRALSLHTADFMEPATHLYREMGFVRVPEYDWVAPSGELVMAYCLDVG